MYVLCTVYFLCCVYRNTVMMRREYRSYWSRMPS